jgi:hypothetical protein
MVCGAHPTDLLTRYIFEICVCEFSVEFTCGGVVSVSGGGFGFEVAEVNSFAVADDGSAPEALIFGEPDAFVAGAGVSLFRVPCVLCDGSEAEVGAAVVEAVAVDVVDDVSIGREDEVVMHKDAGVSAGGQADGAFGVEDVFSFCTAEAPFEGGEAVIIGGVDDCEFALCERDFSEWAAEAQTTIEKKRQNQ